MATLSVTNDVDIERALPLQTGDNQPTPSTKNFEVGERMVFDLPRTPPPSFYHDGPDPYGPCWGLPGAPDACMCRQSLPPTTSPTDPVNHPSHYTFGKLEVIDVIEDWKLGYHLGNAVKYIARADHKGNRLQDLKKARWYLDREIEKGTAGK